MRAKNVKGMVACVIAAATAFGMSGVPQTTPVVSKAAVKLNKKKITLKAGKSVKLKLKHAAKKKVKWTSSKKTVAKVDKNGKVTAVKKGTAKITAKYKGKKYICKVTVKQVPTNSGSTDTGSQDTGSTGSTGDTGAGNTGSDSTGTGSTGSDNSGSTGSGGSSGNTGSDNTGGSTGSGSTTGGTGSDSGSTGSGSTGSGSTGSGSSGSGSTGSGSSGNGSTGSGSGSSGSSGSGSTGSGSSGSGSSGSGSSGSGSSGSGSTGSGSSGSGSSGSGSSGSSTGGSTTGSISMNQHTATVTAGDKVYLSVTGTYSGDVIWTSSNENVAIVSSTGEVQTFDPGTTVITAKCGNISDKCTVTVVEDSGSGSSGSSGSSGGSGSTGDSGNSGNTGSEGGETGNTSSGSQALADYLQNYGDISGTEYTKKGNAVNVSIEYMSSGKIRFSADHEDGGIAFSAWFEYDVSKGAAVSNKVYITANTPGGTYSGYSTSYRISSYKDSTELEFTTEGVSGEEAEACNELFSPEIRIITRAWIAQVKSAADLSPSDIGFTSYVGM